MGFGQRSDKTWFPLYQGALTALLRLDWVEPWVPRRSSYYL